MAGEYLRTSWDRCPLAEIERDDDLVAVQRLRRMAKLSPLSDFPEGYSAGAVSIWLDLESAEAERRAEERQTPEAYDG